MFSDTILDNIHNFSTSCFPYDPFHDRYQVYYRETLRQYVTSRGYKFHCSSPQFSRLLGFLRTVRSSSRLAGLVWPLRPVANRMIDSLAWSLGARRNPIHSLVGQYVVCLKNGKTFQFCVDSHDSGDICSPDLLKRSDLYFKTNYWKSRHYDPKVVPFFNGNPKVLKSCETLAAMRNRPAQYDVCLFVRVWGGKDEVEGVEHCVRMLEAVARIRCRKFVLGYLVAGDIRGLSERLRKAGVPTTTKPLKVSELWKIASRSRMNIIRLGIHYCIPHRMFDLLALGTCPVLDQAPKTIWPAPLVEGQHYLSLNLNTGRDQLVADAAAYDRVPELLESFLSNEQLVPQIRESAAAYFDNNLRPDRVGKRIFDEVCQRIQC